MRSSEFEAVLTGLILGAARIVDEGRSRLLDMIAEDVRDRPRFGEFDHPPSTGDVRGKIGDVEAPGIKMVAGEQNAGFAIVVGDMRGVMTRDGEDVDDAVAQVDRAGLIGPA